MEDIGFGNTILQKTADDRFIIRTTPIDIKTKNMILETLDKEIGINRPPVQDRSVFPGFGRQIAGKALMAIGISILGILIYVWIRFEFRFGATAIAALLHDVLVTLGVYAISNREINKVINDSVNKTLTRSINTSVTTLFPVILLLTLGSPALKDFAFALAVGIISGTYSSIFFASPILVAWNNRFPRYKK